MIRSKKINILVCIATSLALILSLAMIIIGKNSGISAETTPVYAAKVFSTDVTSINIIVDEDDWADMLKNAKQEEFIKADVTINGTKISNIGIRPKGNSSLTSVTETGTNRYSFRLQFDEYVKGQTFYGLESMVVNNMIGDNTYMKEYISYDLMKTIGIDTPYYGFSNLSVNGSNWGLYLALELYNDSYETRVSGDTSGMLYNVKIGGGNMGDKDQIRNTLAGKDVSSERRDFGRTANGEQTADNNSDNTNNSNINPFSNSQTGIPSSPSTSSDFSNSSNSPSNSSTSDFQNDGIPTTPDNMQGASNIAPPDNTFPFSNTASGEGVSSETASGESQTTRKSFMNGGPGGGNSGGSLQYTDDKSSNYSAIFDNAVGKSSESDYKKVVKALDALNNGTYDEIEKYFNIDEILRYLAAHTVVVNLDSYSSNMAQNYYIYEKSGVLSILPWDYNLAFGGFQNSNASSVINFPIDTPVSGVTMDSRPLINKLFENTEYLEKYHSYLYELMNNYFLNGKLDATVDKLDAAISSYVEADSTKFCTYDEYKASLDILKALCALRAKSITGQLGGTVPSTTDAQSKDSSSLIPSNNINLRDLGTMMGGRNNNSSNSNKQPLSEKTAESTSEAGSGSTNESSAKTTPESSDSSSLSSSKTTPSKKPPSPTKERSSESGFSDNSSSENSASNKSTANATSTSSNINAEYTTLSSNVELIINDAFGNPITTSESNSSKSTDSTGNSSSSNNTNDNTGSANSAETPSQNPSQIPSSGEFSQDSNGQPMMPPDGSIPNGAPPDGFVPGDNSDGVTFDSNGEPNFPAASGEFGDEFGPGRDGFPDSTSGESGGRGGTPQSSSNTGFNLNYIILISCLLVVIIVLTVILMRTRKNY